MSTNPFAPKFDDLPEILPIFPLSGVLLLPGGFLPLNIFEPRYVDMVNDALSGSRMVGMVQLKQDGAQEIFDVGCVGRITEFVQTSDGRYEIKLAGICRFDVKEEIEATTRYRQIAPDWSSYEKDLNQSSCLNLDREKLVGLLKKYFDSEGMDCDWDKFDSASDGKLITCLAMACPFSPGEKQALLEAPCCKTRAEMFLKVLEIAACDNKVCTNKH